MEYYIIHNGQQQGPLSVEALRAQSITPDTLVWAPGMSNWAPASQVAELQPLFYAQTAGQAQRQPQQQQQYQQFQQSTAQTFQASTEVLNKSVNQVTDALDDGKAYRSWMPTIYLVAGIIACVLPLSQMAVLLGKSYFDNGLTAVFAVLAILVYLASGVCGLLYWLNRRTAVNKLIGEESADVSRLSGHFLQSTGEWAGLLYFSAKAVVTLLGGIFLGLAASRRVGDIIFEGLGNAAEFILYGMLALCLGRFLGEVAKRLTK